MFITIEDFTALVEKDISAVPEDYMSIYFDAKVSKQKSIDVPDEVISQIRFLQEDHAKQEAILNDINTSRLAGIKAEKENPDAAINYYIDAITTGEKAALPIFHAYSYAYQRLFVLLKKQKRTAEERDFLMQYLKHDITVADRKKYEDRLSKIASFDTL